MKPKYQEIAEQHGKSLAPAGVNGIAFERKYALLALEALRGSGLSVLGGDVYSSKMGRLRLTYDNWSSQRIIGEDPDAFKMRSIEEASRYIANYKESEVGTTLYSIVIKE